MIFLLHILLFGLTRFSKSVQNDWHVQKDFNIPGREAQNCRHEDVLSYILNDILQYDHIDLQWHTVDNILHQLITLLRNSAFYLIPRGFCRAYAPHDTLTGDAYSIRLLFGTCLRSTCWEQSFPKSFFLYFNFKTIAFQFYIALRVYKKLPPGFIPKTSIVHIIN